MGGLGSGPRCGPDGLGQYKTPDMQDSIRAQRGHAQSALFHRVLYDFTKVSEEVKME